MVFSVSVSVPIWFSFIRMALAIPLSMPCWRMVGLVQNRSSPTSSTLDPIASVNAFQPSQSFSAMPSSIETIGYWRIQDDQSDTISSEDFALLSDLNMMYFPFSHISLEAGSRQMEMSL